MLIDDFYECLEEAQPKDAEYFIHKEEALFRESPQYTVVLYYPKLTIVNDEKDVSWTLTDLVLYFHLDVNLDGEVRSIGFGPRLTRFSWTTAEACFKYAHSHCNSVHGAPCFGETDLADRLMFNQERDYEWWYETLLLLDVFLRHESSEGGPYKYIEQMIEEEDDLNFFLDNNDQSAEDIGRLKISYGHNTSNSLGYQDQNGAFHYCMDEMEYLKSDYPFLIQTVEQIHEAGLIDLSWPWDNPEAIKLYSFFTDECLDMMNEIGPDELPGEMYDAIDNIRLYYLLKIDEDKNRYFRKLFSNNRIPANNHVDQAKTNIGDAPYAINLPSGKKLTNRLTDEEKFTLTTNNQNYEYTQIRLVSDVQEIVKGFWRAIRETRLESKAENIRSQTDRIFERSGEESGIISLFTTPERGMVGSDIPYDAPVREGTTIT